MKILLTGANGFVGKALTAQLSDHEVDCYDLPDDILDSVKCSSRINHADMVIHAAAVADLNVSIENQRLNFEVNIRGTYEIARHCAMLNKKLIFISTCCVYGDTPDTGVPDSVETVPMCREPYACSKVAGEYIIRGTPGLEYCILRIGTVFGPGMREALFNYIALSRVLKGETIYVNGTGEQSRQYIYIDDLVDAIARAVDRFLVVQLKTLNVCSTEETSILDTIKTAEDLTGIPAIKACGSWRYGDTLRENISIRDTCDLLQWYPKTTYADGMKKTLYGDKRLNDLLIARRAV